MSTVASTPAGTISRTPSDEVAAGLPVRTDLWVDGGFRPAVSGKRFDRVAPRDGRVVAAVAEGDAADVDLAVAAARRAFEDRRWRDLHPRERRATLLRLADLVERDADELARLESLDVGKPVSHAKAVDIRVTLQTLRFYAEAADKSYDAVAPTGPTVHATITREPLGVVGAVVPWNFPLMMAVWKIAPALAVGNSMVVKPAEQSPLTLLRFAELAAEAGLPDGVLNVVPGFGPTAGAALGRHMDVDALTFTGSGQVGRLFLNYAAESNIKEVSLELGGKSPQLVLADAPDTAAVAKAVAVGVFFNQGEVCSAGSRLVVHRSRKDELVEAVVAASGRLRLGDPLDPQTFVGALVEAEHLERVLGHIGAAHEDGARLLTGGGQVLAETGGYYVEPTVFDDVAAGSRLAQQEVFGPVLAVQTFDDLDEGIALANGTDYGLGASVWTKDLSSAHLVSRRLRAGTVWVNCYDESDITVPFGGYGQSGFGGHDKGLAAMDKYTHTKTTWMAL
ncbi:aldehyde dehydrogenase [Kineosporia sp. R_H_3]|uniref:aldehyde dehydrogenase n=1 Tax=Kineosporia sp. R_H_3 TaxID=1961848 RepID=UPI000B4BFDDF|nr:aldehyde dehydrogenase [Kineosporia sp. R_H_3]